MDNNNQPPSPPPLPPALRHPSSASSFSAQLFDDNNFRQSSTGVFASIFPPPSTMAGNSSCVRCSKPTQYEALDSQVFYTVHGTLAENVAKNTVNANSGVMNMGRRSIFQERIEPCPLSSSIYYGGQEDMYVRSSADLTSKSYKKFLIEEDLKDSPNHMQCATRGNWWQDCARVICAQACILELVYIALVQDRFTIKMLRPTPMEVRKSTPKPAGDSWRPGSSVRFMLHVEDDSYSLIFLFFFFLTGGEILVLS